MSCTHFWSHEDVTLLREMFAAGKSDKEIGKALNRTTDAIEKKRLQVVGHRGRVHNSAFAKRPAEQVAECRIWWDRGLSAAEIGSRVGISGRAVYQIADSYDFPERSEAEAGRTALPPGSSVSWGAITRGTVLEGMEYPL